MARRSTWPHRARGCAFLADSPRGRTPGRRRSGNAAAMARIRSTGQKTISGSVESPVEARKVHVPKRAGLPRAFWSRTGNTRRRFRSANIQSTGRPRAIYCDRAIAGLPWRAASRGHRAGMKNVRAEISPGIDARKHQVRFRREVMQSEADAVAGRALDGDPAVIRSRHSHLRSVVTVWPQPD